MYNFLLVRDYIASGIIHQLLPELISQVFQVKVAVSIQVSCRLLYCMLRNKPIPWFSRSRNVSCELVMYAKVTDCFLYL